MVRGDRQRISTRVAMAYAGAVHQKSGNEMGHAAGSWRTRYAKESLQDRALPERPTFSAEDDPFFAATTFDGGPMELDRKAPECNCCAPNGSS